jgi:hypothetical protein
MICPLMSRPVLTHTDDGGFTTENSDPVMVECLKEDCQWWVRRNTTNACAIVAIAELLSAIGK